MTDELNTPPANGSDAPPAPPPAAPNPLEERLNAVLAEVESLKSARSQDQQLLQQYQTELGRVRQQTPAPKQDDIEARFDEETKRFVTSVAERKAAEIVNQTVGRLSMQADVQQKLGESPELVKRAQTEMSQLKQSPYYSNLSDEILLSIATDRARAGFYKEQNDKAAAEHNKRQQEAQRQQQAADASLPSTARVPWQASADDPDADVKYWESQPENQEMFRKFMRAEPLSETEVQFVAGGKRMKAKDAFRQMAVRAVRTGIQVSSQTAAGIAALGGHVITNDRGAR